MIYDVVVSSLRSRKEKTNKGSHLLDESARNSVRCVRGYTAEAVVCEIEKSQASRGTYSDDENTSYFTFEIRVEWLFFFLSQ